MIYGKEKVFVTEIDLNRFAMYRKYNIVPSDIKIKALVWNEIVSPLMENVDIDIMRNMEELRIKVRVSYREVII